MVKVYNGLGEVENRIKEGRNTLGWEKTSCSQFAPNRARLLMGIFAYNLLHMMSEFYLIREKVKRSMEWVIKRLIKLDAGVRCHARKWPVHAA